MPDNNLQQCDNKLVAGHLRKKKDLFYIVLNLQAQDEHGKPVRKAKWIPTGLPVKNNKTRAEKMLMEARLEYSNNLSATITIAENGSNGLITGNEQRDVGDILFADFMEHWLEVVKTEVRPSTAAGYATHCNAAILPYFRALGVTLRNLTSDDIEAFYIAQRKRPVKNKKTATGEQAYVKPSTIIHYHRLIHKALKYARKKNKIDLNPMDTVDRPKFDDYIGKYYSVDEVNQMLDVAKGSKLEIPMIFASFYGLRRGEIVGLKWDAVDFDNNTFIVKRTVTDVYEGGKRRIIEEEKVKSKSSRRTMILVEPVKERLLEIRDKQEANRKLCGNSYNQKYAGSILVDDLGNLIKPDYITQSYATFLDNNKLRRIRFHDLRHTCASLLYANGAQLKDISEYLGHSTIAITSKIYVHLDFKNKIKTTSTMMDCGINLQ